MVGVIQNKNKKYAIDKWTYMSILLSVVSNDGVPPKVVDTNSTANNVSVVEFMVVADPGSDESPEGFDGWVSSKSSNFLWLSTCIISWKDKEIRGRYSFGINQ